MCEKIKIRSSRSSREREGGDKKGGFNQKCLWRNGRSYATLDLDLPQKKKKKKKKSVSPYTVSSSWIGYVYPACIEKKGGGECFWAPHS